MKHIKPHLQKSTERMYHMPGPINRHKRKWTGIPYRPNLPTINVPRPQLLVSVVRANVNDHFHATVQQGGDVVWNSSIVLKNAALMSSLRERSCGWRARGRHLVERGRQVGQGMRLLL